RAEKAVEYAQRALDLDSKQIESYLKIGQGRLMKALEDSKPDDLGRMVPNMDQVAEAAKIATRLQHDHPDSVDGPILQARIDQINGRLTDAERLYRGVLQKDSSNQSAQSGLVDALFAQKKYLEAVEAAKPLVV